MRNIIRLVVALVLVVISAGCRSNLHKKEVRVKKLHGHRYAYFQDNSWWYMDAGGSSPVINPQSQQSGRTDLSRGGWVRSDKAPREEEVEDEEMAEIEETEAGDPASSSDISEASADGGSSSGDAGSDSGDGGGGGGGE